MRKKLFTIVTVVYNDVGNIEKTIESVLAQKNKNYEYILIDGKSTDGTLDILDKYKKNFDVYISEKDNGIYDAMNKATKVSNGEYIIFLNSGDLLNSSSVLNEIENEIIKNQSPDTLLFKVANYDGEVIGKYKHLNIVNYETYGCHQGYVIKTELQKRFLFDTNYKIKADRQLLLNIFQNDYRIITINKYIVKYLDGGVSSKDIINKEKENIKISIYNNVKLRYIMLVLCISSLKMVLFKLSELLGVNWESLKKTTIR
ncbi:glycosyltransferase family 2 protein [Halobacillus litoralis]|uniref:glycosyltransferase family 2 protein n=1 Tax=Halobacillus litoralis TaxID=45668 RepID=UPI001CFD51C9|nr:glycosyltransferase family 2 protein [Halobacillus litoralis]